MPQADDAVVRAVRSCASALIGLAAHELNNRLAVMRETVGLMDDLARAGRAAATGTTRAHASLDDQVGRALNIVRTLSGLGGALGCASAGFDVGEAVGGLLGLTERWTRQSSLGLEREIAGDLPRADGDPALFLCLFYRLLGSCTQALRPGGSVAVRVARDGAAIRVRLAPSGERAEGAAAAGITDEELDRELARRLGAELQFEGGGATTIVLAAVR
jgi:signal transduction histidine kinase